jgi:hypothetical protein
MTHQIEGRSGSESRDIPVPGFRMRSWNRFEVDEMGTAEAAACEKSGGCVLNSLPLGRRATLARERGREERGKAV